MAKRIGVSKTVREDKKLNNDKLKMQIYFLLISILFSLIIGLYVHFYVGIQATVILIALTLGTLGTIGLIRIGSQSNDKAQENIINMLLGMRSGLNAQMKEEARLSRYLVMEEMKEAQKMIQVDSTYSVVEEEEEEVYYFN